MTKEYVVARQAAPSVVPEIVPVFDMVPHNDDRNVEKSSKDLALERLGLPVSSPLPSFADPQRLAFRKNTTTPPDFKNFLTGFAIATGKTMLLPFSFGGNIKGWAIAIGSVLIAMAMAFFVTMAIGFPYWMFMVLSVVLVFSLGILYKGGVLLYQKAYTLSKIFAHQEKEHLGK